MHTIMMVVSLYLHAKNTLSYPTALFFQGTILTLTQLKRKSSPSGVPLRWPGPRWNSTPKGKSIFSTLMLCLQGRGNENSTPYWMSLKRFPYADTFIKPKRNRQNLVGLADEQGQRIMHLQRLFKVSSSKVDILSSSPSKVHPEERHLACRLFLRHHITGSSSRAEDFLCKYNQASLPGHRMKACLGACPTKCHSNAPPSAPRTQAWGTFLKKASATKASLPPSQNNSPAFLHLGFPDPDDASPEPGVLGSIMGHSLGEPDAGSSQGRARL